MSVQWTFVAGFLYAEIGVVLLLVLPIIPPRKWNQFFKSKFVTALRKHASWYFMVILFILVLFLLDAVREMKKYSDTSSHEYTHAHLDSEMQSNMRLFRAQRNFYISGFSLFLCLVIRRLITLITTQASLSAQCEAALSQARNATAAAREYFAAQDNGNEQEHIATNESNKIKELEEKLAALEEALEKEQKDKEAIKSQADNNSKEYDRLLEEHGKLQKLAEGAGDKKHD